MVAHFSPIISSKVMRHFSIFRESGKTISTFEMP